MLKDRKNLPQLIIFPATVWGRSVASYLSIKAGAGLTAECIEIDAVKEKEDYDFVFTRAAINSSVLTQIRCINTKIGMCTCKENVFTITDLLPRKEIKIFEYKNERIMPVPLLEKLGMEAIEACKRNIKLENAKVVFGVGRGVRDQEDMQLIEHVAQKYNAAIAGTRPLVEAGFLDKQYQVGQSGISIEPDVYVAIGISGATQHIVGIKNAKRIISINTDRDAPIISYSNYSIIEDFRSIFMKMISE